MATNKPSGDNHRNGAVRQRSQTHNPQNDKFVKREHATGKFVDQKTTGRKFKGVRKERSS